MPELDLTFDKGSQILEVRLPRPPIEPSAPSLEQIRTKHNQLTDMDMFSGRILDEGVFHEYNLKVRAYYKDYEIYLEQLLEFEKYLARWFSVRLTLSNDGSAPATDIDLYLDHPKYIDAILEDDRPDLPSAPEPPRKPTHFPDVSAGVLAII